MYKEGPFRRVRHLVSRHVFALLISILGIGTGLAATNTVTLGWDASTSENVLEYRVYYGVLSGDYTNVVSAGGETNLTINGLVQGSVYFFAATAVDMLGQESDYSVET